MNEDNNNHAVLCAEVNNNEKNANDKANNAAVINNVK